ncbi:MAG: GNAT family N-acetyltransferase [Lysobacteraceae bacterium]
MCDSIRLETERLILRPTRMEDLDAWVAFMADPEAARFIGGPQPPASVWRSMMAMAGSWRLMGFSMFSVIERDSGRWIGRVGPWRPEGWPGNEIGWGLIREAWGQGYAREAATASIDWAFETLGWTEMIHCIDPDNRASQALAHRLGSANSGVGRLPPPFETLPVHIWRQSREQWQDNRRHGRV